MKTKFFVSTAFFTLLTAQTIYSAPVDTLKSDEKEVVAAHPTSETPAERAISDKIHAAIQKDNRFSNAARKIQIATKGGIVTLSGHVNSESEKIRIKAIAQNIEGVTSVLDQIVVKTATPGR